MSIEQMVRDLLEQAIKDGLVNRARDKHINPDPQSFSSGQLTGCANVVCEWIVEDMKNGRRE